MEEPVLCRLARSAPVDDRGERGVDRDLPHRRRSFPLAHPEDPPPRIANTLPSFPRLRNGCNLQFLLFGTGATTSAGTVYCSADYGWGG